MELFTIQGPHPKDGSLDVETILQKNKEKHSGLLP